MRYTTGALHWNMITKVCDLENSHGGFLLPTISHCSSTSTVETYPCVRSRGSTQSGRLSYSTVSTEIRSQVSVPPVGAFFCFFYPIQLDLPCFGLHCMSSFWVIPPPRGETYPRWNLSKRSSWTYFRVLAQTKSEPIQLILKTRPKQRKHTTHRRGR